MEDSSQANLSILEEIERSIQNAKLSLFRFAGLDDGLNSLLNTEDAPTAPHTPIKYGSEFNEVEDQTKARILSSPLRQTDNESPRSGCSLRSTTAFNQHLNNPFPNDPIKNSVVEMQKLLNTQSTSCTPMNLPSPKELLELYSQNLGIGSTGTHLVAGETTEVKGQQKSKRNKKDKQITKKHKEQSTELKHTQNYKQSKDKNNYSKDNKFEELMKIYGSTNQVVMKHSNSTLDSKSVSGKKSSTKFLQKDRSGTVCTKKSKRKKHKLLIENDKESHNEDFIEVERMSKLSLKKRNKNAINNKLLRKKLLKQKTEPIYNNKGYETSKQYHNENSKSCNVHKRKSDVYGRQKDQSKTTNNLLKARNTVIEPKNLRCVKSITQKHNSALNVNPCNMGQQTVKSHSLEMQKKKSDDALTEVKMDKRVANSLTDEISQEGPLNNCKVFPSNNKQNYNDNFIGDLNANAAHLGCDISCGELHGEDLYHYTLPTQSSRSKEVEKFLRGHYQHCYIPFVIGQSTNKSHNLWVNIQEALSLVKQKCPMANEVVSDGTTEGAYSVSSKMTIKSTKRQHVCPAILNGDLYDIPENDEIELRKSKSWEDNPVCIQANVDPDKVRPRCSCFPHKTVGYKRVLNQLFGRDDTSSMNDGAGDILDCRGKANIAEFRETLQRIGKEFEELNKQYEELISNPNASKSELEQLKLQLDRKEDQIREILAKYNEVPVERGRDLDPYKSTTSVRLTRALRRVQQFKESLQGKPSIPHLHAKNAY